MDSKVAVVTGGSGGIGLATAKRFAANGYTVYEFSRSGAGQDGIKHITVDVTDAAAVKAAMDDLYIAEKRLDLLITNAGFGISGAVEFTDIAEARRQFDVNFFGTAAALAAALPYLRAHRGRAIAVGSVAGAIPIPFQAYYSASNAAVGALVEAARSEVRPYGVTLCCLLPGDVQTGFTDVRQKNHAGDDIYCGRIGRSVAGMERDERSGMTPDYVAKRIFRIAKKRSVRPFYSVGPMYIFLSFAARILPRRLVNWAVGLMYAK